MAKSELLQGLDLVPAYKLMPEVDLFQVEPSNLDEYGEELTITVRFPLRLELRKNRKDFTEGFNNGFHWALKWYETHASWNQTEPIIPDTYPPDIEVEDFEDRALSVDLPNWEAEMFLGELWEVPTMEELEEVLARDGRWEHPYKEIHPKPHGILDFPIIEEKLRQVWNLWLSHMIIDSQWVFPIAKKTGLEPVTVLSIVRLFQYFYEKYQEIWQPNTKVLKNWFLANY